MITLYFAINQPKKDFFMKKFDLDLETMDKLIALDNPQSSYIAWLCREFAAGRILESDFDKIKQQLKDFDTVKNKPLFIDSKNILDYTPGKLFTLLQGYQGLLGPSKKQEVRDKIKQDVAEGSEIVLEEGIWTVYKATTFPAARALGSGTNWCTTQEEHAPGLLEQGPLYVIRKNGRNYAQFHAPTGQLKDVTDEEFFGGADTLTRWCDDHRLGQLLPPIGVMMSSSGSGHSAEGLKEIMEELLNKEHINFFLDEFATPSTVKLDRYFAYTDKLGVMAMMFYEITEFAGKSLSSWLQQLGEEELYLMAILTSTLPYREAFPHVHGGDLDIWQVEMLKEQEPGYAKRVVDEYLGDNFTVENLSELPANRFSRIVSLGHPANWREIFRELLLKHQFTHVSVIQVISNWWPLADEDAEVTQEGVSYGRPKADPEFEGMILAALGLKKPETEVEEALTEVKWITCRAVPARFFANNGFDYAMTIRRSRWRELEPMMRFASTEMATTYCNSFGLEFIDYYTADPVTLRKNQGK
jgi:hypothetical protein